MIEMTLATAERVARASQDRAAAIGIAITVSVVDEAGRLVLTMKGDRTGFLTTETARAKAVAAAAFKMSTLKIAQMHATNVFWSAIPALSRGEALPTGGAVPITKEGRVIGAVGCGGGTAEQDDDCALAGAAAA